MTVQANAAAQKETNFRLDTDLALVDGVTTVLVEVYNDGPDTMPFEIIAWYSIVFEFPAHLIPFETNCDQLEYEDRGTTTVGVCTRHGPDHDDLPRGRLLVTRFGFDGQPTVCETVTAYLRLDNALRDPTPERDVYSFGLNDGCQF